LAVFTNQSVYRAGDKLMVSASVNDPGIAENTYIYFGMLLPDGTHDSGVYRSFFRSIS
jgi:hypothetical protein